MWVTGLEFIRRTQKAILPDLIIKKNYKYEYITMEF